MKYYAFGVSILVGLSAIGTSANATDVSAAIKTFEEVAATPAKMQTYCAMTKLIDEVGDDEKKAEKAESEIDGYFKALGPEFEEAWTAGDELSEESAELKSLEAALTKLDEACVASDGSPDDASADDAAGDDAGSADTAKEPAAADDKPASP